MTSSFSCIGIGLTLTVAALSGLGMNLSMNPSSSTKLPSQKTANSDCSLTSVRICRSQIIDPQTGTVIFVSNLKKKQGSREY